MNVYQPWYDYWERDEARRKRESGHPADILARMGPFTRVPAAEEHGQRAPALVIPAGTSETRREQATEALRAIVTARGSEGVAPRDALRQLKEQGFEYRPTDSELGLVKRAAGVGWTRTGQRGYRWHVRQLNMGSRA